MMQVPLSRRKILAALRMSIAEPDSRDPSREIWQMAQSNLAANLYGRIVLGEFDEDGK